MKFLHYTFLKLVFHIIVKYERYLKINKLLTKIDSMTNIKI